MEIIAGGEADAQVGNQIPVQFHYRQLSHLIHQVLGEGAQAGADFHHQVLCLGADGMDDLVDDARILQEVLPEALARLVFAESGFSTLGHDWLLEFVARLGPCSGRC